MPVQPSRIRGVLVRTSFRASTEGASARATSGDADVVFVCEDVCTPGTKVLRCYE